MSALRTDVGEARPKRLLADLKDPLFKSGHSLVLSSLLTSVIGFAFWILAARLYRPSVVGTDSVELSTMMFLSGVAQLNLAGALVRFVPLAGRHRRRFILGSYAVSAAISTVLAVAFLFVAGHLSSSFTFLHDSRPMELWWIVATIVWGIFVLEDGALTGLRRATWVPVENAGFSVGKIVLVLVLAASFHRSGIFLAWTIATALTVIPLNVAMLLRAVPAEQDRHPDGDVSVAQLARYIPFDYMASLAWLAATSLLPLLIVKEAGTAANAYFSLSWLISYFLYLVSINVGSSLIVEVSANPDSLYDQSRRVVIHLLKLVCSAVVLIELGAPWILRLFGRAYVDASVTTLRLLVLSAVPFVITSTMVSGLRAKRNTKAVLCVDAGICCSVIGMSWFALPRYGIVGAGWAWLISQCVVAAVLCLLAWPDVARHRTSVTSGVRFKAARMVIDSRLAGPVITARARWSTYRADRYVNRVFPALLAELESDRDASRPPVRGRTVKPSVSDTTVALLDDGAGAPLGVIKIPRSERARADLHQGSENVESLAENLALGTWRRLLPSTNVRFAERPFVYEAHIPGCTAEELIGLRPDLAVTVAAASLAAIAPMHRATSRRRLIDAVTFEELTANSFGLLRSAHPNGRVPERHEAAVDRLRERLGTASIGREFVLATVHGDFSPGNVILAEDASGVTGIVDWGQSRSRGIPALDVLSFLAAVHCRQERCELGTFVVEVLDHPRWPRVGLLGLAEPFLVEVPLDPRDVMLWCWLEHVAGNLAKSERYARSTLWWAANIEPVLQKVAR